MIQQHPLTETQRDVLRTEQRKTRREAQFYALLIPLWVAFILVGGHWFADSLATQQCLLVAGVVVWLALMAFAGWRSTHYQGDLDAGMLAVYEGPITLRTLQSRYGKRYLVVLTERTQPINGALAKQIVAALEANPAAPYRVMYSPNAGHPFGVEPALGTPPDKHNA